MKIETMNDLMVDLLQDMYSSETQLAKALGKMVQKANAQPLRKAFEAHLEETKEQITRLEEACKILDVDPEGEKCEVMESLIEEAEEIIKNVKDKEVLDAALIASSQKVEHYEIASYGTLVTFAKLLGEDKIAKLLAKTLDEEKKTDEKLTKLAESKINEKAMQ